MLIRMIFAHVFTRAHRATTLRRYFIDLKCDLLCDFSAFYQSSAHNWRTVCLITDSVDPPLSAYKFLRFLLHSLMPIVRYNIRSKDKLRGDEYLIYRIFSKPRIAPFSRSGETSNVSLLRKFPFSLARILASDRRFLITERFYA